jgi:thioredoxin reductase (NADPH)
MKLKNCIEETVIISTGASAKYLGLPSEQTLFEKMGGGVLCCSFRRFFYRNQEVVISAGDSAVRKRIICLNFAKK